MEHSPSERSIRDECFDFMSMFFVCFFFTKNFLFSWKKNKIKQNADNGLLVAISYLPIKIQKSVNLDNAPSKTGYTKSSHKLIQPPTKLNPAHALPYLGIE